MDQLVKVKRCRNLDEANQQLANLFQLSHLEWVKTRPRNFKLPVGLPETQREIFSAISIARAEVDRLIPTTFVNGVFPFTKYKSI